LGRKATKDAIVKVIADSVWMVSHQITANCTAAEPKIEKACPVYITTNCFFQFFILFIIEISSFIAPQSGVHLTGCVSAAARCLIETTSTIMPER
jgi:hypothetical protein